MTCSVRKADHATARSVYTSCRVSEVRWHSAGDASLLHPNAAAALGAPGLAALLTVHMFPTCSLFAPCQAGASPPSVQQRTSETRHSRNGQVAAGWAPPRMYNESISSRSVT